MKKILGLLLACMLVLSMTAALAAPADMVMFNLQGYAIGLNAEDTRLKWNGDWLSNFEYVTDPIEMEISANKGLFGIVHPIIVLDDDSEGGGIVTGPLKADQEYVLQIIVPLSTDAEEAEAKAMLDEFNFDLVNGHRGKNMFMGTLDLEGGTMLAMFEFDLPPVPNDLPDSGDGAELMMWSAMVAFAAVGLITLSRKARREY